jgi:signal transduction histidine kinase
MTRLGPTSDADRRGGGQNGAMRIPIRLRPPLTDALLAVGFAVAALAWVLANRHGSADGPLSLHRIKGDSGLVIPSPPIKDVGSSPDPLWPPILMNLACTVPLAWRRRLPYAAFLVAIVTIFAIRSEVTWPAFVGALTLAYSMVAYGRRLAVSLGVVVAAGTVSAFLFSDSIPPMPGWLTPFATLVPIGLLATVIRFTRARADAAARRAEALERERETATRAALAEERARIARELHDVVSHHVSVMVIQADAANAMVPTQPELAQQALTAIAASGREAMTELRHLLGLVAPLDDTLHPQPGLAELDALVDKVRAVGQPVTVTARVTGLPQGVDLTAYRVVQEGLTNAMRYAPGAVTQVELRREGDTLRVEVRNDAADRPATTGLGSGTGLLNLAERVRLYRGTIHSGLRPGGGFRLLARIPLTEPGALVP